MASLYSSAEGVIARTKAEIVGTADTIVRVGARSSFPALAKPLSYAMLSPPWPDDAVQSFQRKYDWTITADAEYDTLIAVRPERWLMAQQ